MHSLVWPHGGRHTTIFRGNGGGKDQITEKNGFEDKLLHLPKMFEVLGSFSKTNGYICVSMAQPLQTLQHSLPQMIISLFSYASATF